MIEDLKDKLIRLIENRAIYLFPFFIIFSVLLVLRIFNLQIIHGEEYLNNFVLEQKKITELSARRGNIYDKNGNLLAYDELAYNVKIEDTTESGKERNQKLNNIIFDLITFIEKCGDNIDSDFGLYIDQNDEFAFKNEGTSKLRFLADIYGHKYISELTDEELLSTPMDIMEFLSRPEKFQIGEYKDPNDKKSGFLYGFGYTKDYWLKIVTIRYNMSLTYYRKYVGTVVATDVSEKTIAVIMENSDILPGVSISEDTVRRYVDSLYFSHLLGYTGKISSEELEELEAEALENNTELLYNRNSVIGKSGIEKSMEDDLRGQKGTQTIMVNSTGKVLSILDEKNSIAGNDVYLSIDKDLTIAIYNLIEQKLAGIISSKIVNQKYYDPDPEISTNDIVIPIYDVYYALIDNSVIDLSHLTAKDSTENEKTLYAQYVSYEERAFELIENELLNKSTPYQKLSRELKKYEDQIISIMIRNNTIDSSLIDPLDNTQIAWEKEETISISDYIKYCIAVGWIDSEKLMADDKYSDSDEIYRKVIELTMESLRENTAFKKLFYKYMLLNNVISPELICKILCEQGAINVPDDERNRLFAGRMNAYNFIMNRINNIDLTPAQLALDPCNAGVVVTEANSGKVLAVVTYPGYDNNKMANSIDAAYYSKLLNDKSNPLYNFATQYKGAPGSTYKLVSSTAAISENIVRPNTTIFCSGTFESITPSPKCWRVWGHGTETLQTAIRDSCNYYYYEVGYRLSTLDGKYDADAGLAALAKYADMYGLSEETGIEMAEEQSKVSDMDPVRSAIGQGTNAYTTVALARYAAALANRGTVYNLSLIDSVRDANNNILSVKMPEIRNTITMEDSTWDVLHQGMKAVVDKMSYYSALKTKSAGKTGTAQQSNIRPNHAVYIGFAPYNDPEIAIAARINFGYSSDYPAQLTRDILKYYFNEEDEDLLDGKADTSEHGLLNQD